ncbi:hypothetical protein Calow_2213 [Caldicellulosiruptor owensensis OL]|uniref:GGDEF domain-containing protein n=1 Tax=Caldicellulosiruptor owensensis (strain ATCC 700167 / DSM 13100 / OL) TaxID=632518 RepID=E4Q736_CALOW|nr:type III-A CRISPR-associated protein Cas10/Csm1 [Caldicellulosiruptor owensensis]ADQ05716.1 hypothetical protein Calow_2213 [Caldicellulosiruptor owensensis OL]
MQKREIINTIAFAALMHDIGKFVRRSGLGKSSHEDESKEFLNRYKGIIQQSSLFSSEQLELVEKLVVNHHNNLSSSNDSKFSDDEKNLLKILIYSDWDSASERSTETEATGSQEYLPIHSILSFINEAFEIDEVWRQGKEEEAGEYLLQIKAFLPQDALLYRKPELDSNTSVVKENEKMFNKFEKEFNSLIKSSSSQDEFIMRLNYILKRYSTYITSSGKERVRDISLYHHSATTAAFAVNRYIDFVAGEKIDRYKKMGVIYGRLFKIQDYIFSGINSKIEKPLRRIITRSQLVSILNMLIPYDIIKTLKLYPFNIIFYGGGAFLIFIPCSYIQDAERKISEIKQKVADIFESKIYFEAICDQISIVDENGKYTIGNELKRLGAKLSDKKLSRSFDTIPSLFQEGYFDRKYFKCNNCSINSSNVIQEGEDYICKACYIENKWMNIDISKIKINVENLKVENIESPEHLEGDLRKNESVVNFSNQGIDEFKCIDTFLQGRKFIYNIHVCKKCPVFDKCNEPYKFDTSEPKDNDAKKIISTNCLEKLSNSDNIIATAKMDIDDLGFILYQVYPVRASQKEEYPFSVSRLSYASWLLNLFFTEGVKSVIDEKFKNEVMILYSGGDDLLITGVWEKVIEAIDEIEKEFSMFITGKIVSQRNVTVTSSIVFHRANENFDAVIKSVSEGLEKAKAVKNSVYIFDAVLSYPKLRESKEIAAKIVEYVEKKILTKSMVAKLLDILENRKKSRKIPYLEIKAVSQYCYLKRRLIEENRKLSKEQKEEVIEFLDSFMLIPSTCRDVDMQIVAVKIALRKLIKNKE